VVPSLLKFASLILFAETMQLEEGLGAWLKILV